VVDGSVGLMSLDVFVSVLGSGDGEDSEKGEDDETGRDGGEFGEELEDGDSEEEDIGNSSELGRGERGSGKGESRCQQV
jgi:hypothetical protein